jgi:hypothetical protein
MMLCIPGPWGDRKELLTRIVRETGGEYMFVGNILAQPKENRHIQCELFPQTVNMREAFEIAGQSKFSAELLAAIEMHSSVAYLTFDEQFSVCREKIAAFTSVFRRIGGFAVKIESTGLAYEWPEWFDRISSQNPFDWYRTCVTLIGDDEWYYSCGMHHFGLPDVEVSRQLDPKSGAELMNQFNYWQVIESPVLGTGHTFSVSPDPPYYRLELRTDYRHNADDLFCNPHGLWRLMAVEQTAAPKPDLRGSRDG